MHKITKALRNFTIMFILLVLSKVFNPSSARQDFVDGLQFLSRKYSIRERAYRVFDLSSPARANQGRCHFLMPEHPRDGHLCQCLTTPCRTFTQTPNFLQLVIRDLFRFEKTVGLRGARVRRDTCEVPISQEPLSQ